MQRHGKLHNPEITCKVAAIMSYIDPVTAIALSALFLHERMTPFGALGAVLVGLLIFLPAGTLNYSNGWLLMGLLFVPMLICRILRKLKIRYLC